MTGRKVKPTSKSKRVERAKIWDWRANFRVPGGYRPPEFKPIFKAERGDEDLRHHPKLGDYAPWTGDPLDSMRAPRDEDVYCLEGVHDLADIEAGNLSHVQKTKLPFKFRKRDFYSPGWSANLYAYSPLRTGGRPQIRFIEVLEDFSHDCLLRCSIKTGFITDDYIAVSYVWGQEVKEACEIVVNGKICRIQENLWTFLRVVRKKFAGKWFWIDAISINQQDVKERSDQVQRMGEIFENAERVLEWLGDDPSMLKFLQLVEDHYSNSKSVPGERMAAEFPLHQNFKKLSNWRRAWITQELLLAKKLDFLAGPHEDKSNPSVQTSYLALNAFIADKDIQKKLGPFRRLDQELNKRRDGNQNKRPLINLLCTFQSKECRVERDKIYSLLALSDEGPDIHVNYDTSELTFVQHVLEVCSKSACLCSAKLLAAILHAWTSTLETPQSYAQPAFCFDYVQHLYLPLFKFNMRQWHLLDIGANPNSSRSKDTAPKPQSNMRRCSNCDKPLQLPKDTLCSRALCFMEVCSINTCHLLWETLPFGEVQFFLSLRDDKASKHHVSKVGCEISLEGKCKDGSIIVGFSLQALLSQSWFSLKDQEAVRMHGKLSKNQKICKAARDRQTSFKLCSGSIEPQGPLEEEEGLLELLPAPSEGVFLAETHQYTPQYTS